MAERQIMIGIGPAAVRQPRVRDREAGATIRRVRFTPAVLPRYARRSKSLDTLIPDPLSPRRVDRRGGAGRVARQGDGMSSSTGVVARPPDRRITGRMSQGLP